MWAHRKLWTLLMFVCVRHAKNWHQQRHERPQVSFQPPATLIKRLLANKSTQRAGRCHHEVTIDYSRKVFAVVEGSWGLGRMKMALIFKKGTKEDLDNLGRWRSKSWKHANHPQNYFSAYDWQEGDGVVSMGLQRGNDAWPTWQLFMKMLSDWEGEKWMLFVLTLARLSALSLITFP